MTTETASPVADPAPPRPFSIPIFRNVWFASMASNFGGLVQGVGAAWLMLSLGGTATQVALVQASVTLPIMVMSLFAGAIADSHDRRSIMLYAQSFMLVCSALLAFAAWRGMLSPVSLLMFTFLIGCGTAMNGPAWQALVGDMVPRATLPAAVTMNSMGFNIARSVGPALGGIIVAVAGSFAAFAFNALSYIPLIAVLARWRAPQNGSNLPRETVGAAMLAGVRYVSASPAIMRVILRAALFGLGAAAVPSLLPLVSRHLVAGDATIFGLLSGTFGAGAVLGAYGASRLRRTQNAERLIRAAILLVAVGTAIVAASRILPVTMLGLFLAGMGWVAALSSFNVSVQMNAPRWVVGRALSLYQMGTFGAMAVGSWLAGAIAQHGSIALALYVATAIMAAGLIAALLFPVAPDEALNLDLSNHWHEPDLAVAIEPRSGPVVITVEYHIAEANQLAFLAAMNERRRIRRRDGARHWRLLRDLGDPELWVERYDVPSWTDYVRHNMRRTVADTDNFAAIRALHEGSWPPPIHRMLEREPGRQAVDPLPDREAMTDPARSS